MLGIAILDITEAAAELEPDIEHSRGYIYANLRLPDPVTWTLGVSYDDYEEEALNFNVEEVSPKFGVQS